VLDSLYSFMCFFFFQAEDGIRDRNVTGVQTCALPILKKWKPMQANIGIVNGLCKKFVDFTLLVLFLVRRCVNPLYGTTVCLKKIPSYCLIFTERIVIRTYGKNRMHFSQSA